MSTLRPEDTLTDSWQQVEDFLANLHAWACAPLDPPEFYGRLIEGSVRTLAAFAGAAWQADFRGRWTAVAEKNLTVVLPNDEAASANTRLLQSADAPCVVQDGGGIQDGHAILIGAIKAADGPRPPVVIELFMRTGASPAAQEGWEEFLRAMLAAAETFELQHELRALRHDRARHADVLSLLRRIHSGKTLQEVAFDLANEGARYLHADRLSVLIKRADVWKLIAASSVEHFEERAEAVHDLEALAEVTAHWGEPLEYADGVDESDLPPAVATALLAHIDHSHARRLLAVPIEFHRDDDAKLTGGVLIAESFAAGDVPTRASLMELAELCEPALAQVIAWDHWPIRSAVEWTHRWTRLKESWGITRLGFVAGTLAALLLALTFVRTNFEIEAAATLMPRNVRDVFATAKGTVDEIKVAHGEIVKQGDVLAVLDDSQLALEIERVRGELETTRKRLEAIAIARTDRQTREELAPDRLPLSAEAKQLELRQASLVEQQRILLEQQNALTLRSPIAGTVLTLDVQNLLRGRPVERGQVLFTVADADSGWQLETRVPQDLIGHVVTAAEANEEPLPVRFKLAGDREHSFTGHVSEITKTAVVDPKQLGEELPEVVVRVAVDDEAIPRAKPEMQARVRINCGRRSVGYVWLHDAWDNLLSWMAF